MASSRIEYPISGKYCENWTEVEALRELIANMLDSSDSYRTSHKRGVAVFEDDGPGFDASCLMLGEGEEKSDAQIGQFKEGLKLALLTLAREGRDVKLETTGFTVDAAKMEPTALGRDGLVLYVDREKCRNTGTRVTVQCRKKIYDKARNLFLTFAHDRPHGEFTEASGMFSPPKGRKWGNVYVNGLLTEGGNWAYDYNIVGASAKSAMNRDRSVLDSAATNSSVSYILSSVESESTRLHVLKTLLRNPSARENKLSLRWVGRGWDNTLSGALGVQSLDKVVRSDGNMSAERRAEEYGYHVISVEALPGLFHDYIRYRANTATSKVSEIEAQAQRDAEAANRKKKKRAKVDYGPYELADWEDLSDGDVQLLNSAASLALLWAQNNCLYVRRPKYTEPDCVNFFLYARDRTGTASQAVMYEGMIGIHVDTVSKIRSGYRGQLETLVGIIIHELAHATSLAEDCTREFENELTRLIGLSVTQVMAAYDKPVPALDVRFNAGSKKRVKPAELDLHPYEFRWEEISEALAASEVGEDGYRFSKVHYKLPSQAVLDKAADNLWRLYCVEFDAHHMSHAAAADTKSITYFFLSHAKSGTGYYGLQVTVSDIRRRSNSRRRMYASVILSPTQTRRWVLSRPHQSRKHYKEVEFDQLWPHLHARMNAPQAAYKETKCDDTNAD